MITENFSFFNDIANFIYYNMTKFDKISKSIQSPNWDMQHSIEGAEKF